MSSIQWDHDLIFKYFADGYVGTIPPWTSGLSGGYIYLDRVNYIDGGVYEMINVNNLLVSTVPPNVDTDNWIKVLDSFIGARERSRYNGQKLMLEYMLNRRFQVATYSIIEWEIQWIAGVPTPQPSPPYQQIYIKQTVNSQSNFWLSNGGAGSLTSYMAAASTNQNYYLGNAYSAYTAIQFTIFVPTAVYASIQAYQLPGVTADQAIVAVIDQYVQAGSIYVITQY